MSRVDVIRSQVRPIKKLFLLDSSDTGTFVEIIRIVSQEIGGIYNLILAPEGNWFDEVTLRFIARHDPDIVLNYSGIDTNLIRRKLRTPTFASPPLSEVKRLTVSLLSLWDNVPPLFLDAVKDKGPEVYAVVADAGAEVDLHAALHFGIVPPDFSIRDQSLFSNITVRPIDRSKFFDCVHDIDRNFLCLSLGLSMGVSGGGSIYEIEDNPEGLFRRAPTVIFGSTASLPSMLYYWNIRATYPYAKVCWVPIELLDELAPFLRAYEEFCMTEPEVLRAAGTAFFEGRRRIDCSRYYFDGPDDPWKSFEHTSTVSVIGGRLHVEHPTHKLFSRIGINMDFALEIQGPEEMIAPKSVAVGELFLDPHVKYNPLGFARIGSRGFSTRVRQFNMFFDVPVREEFKLPEDIAVIEALFQEQGFSASRTKGSGLLDQTLNQLGGYEGLSKLASEKALQLLFCLTPKRTQRIIDQLRSEIGTDRNTVDALVRIANQVHLLTPPTMRTLTSLEGTLKIKKEERSSFYELVEDLYSHGVLLRGKRFECAHCHTTLWFPLERLVKPLKCYGCDSLVTLPVSLREGSEDSYRLNELFVQAVDQGVIAALLTMRVIWKQRYFGRRIAGALEIRRNGNFFAEADLVFTLGGDFGLCEVKSDQDFDLAQLSRLRELSHEVGARLIVLSTLRRSDSSHLKDILSYMSELEKDILTLILPREVLLEASPEPKFYKYYDKRRRGNVFLVS